MTLSDPLLKELKGHIAKLVLFSTPPYGDDNESVFLLCHCIESIFLKGLIRHDGFTPWRTDSFSWFYQLVRKYHRVIPLEFKLAFEEVLNDTKTRTQTGKTRLLIRSCLRRRCLHVPIQFHIENQDYNDASLRVNYSTKDSIMGHEILSQIFLSLILQMSHYEFNYDLKNSSFLDESWQIPAVIKAEFVPCDKLGLTLGFPLGFAVIVDIIENSLAAELGDKIAVGDIMDEFNGMAVRNFYGSKIESLFKKNRYQPFKITFIKATDSKGQLYLPAIKLYRILGLDPERLTYSKPLRKTEDSEQRQDDELIHNEQNYNNQGNCEQSSTNLIQGLLQEESQNTLLETNETEEINQPKQSNYSEILSALTDPNNPNTDINAENTSTSPALLDLDLDSQGTIDWDFNGFMIPEKPNETGKENLQKELKKFETDNTRQDSKKMMEKAKFANYYDDDSNPCMV